MPGLTDETMYVLQHRGGWFEGASDNASKVATMLGLSNSRGFRGRSDGAIVFLGSSGHHNNAGTTGFSTSKSTISGTWLFHNRETVFSKTALFINCEHTSPLLIYVHVGANRIRRVNTYTGLQWYTGGPSRPKLQDLSVKEFKDFGVATYAKPERAAPEGEAGGVWSYVL